MDERNNKKGNFLALLKAFPKIDPIIDNHMKHGKRYLDDSIENSKQYYACPAEYVGRKTRASLS